MTDHLPECPEINEKPDWYCCEDCDPGPWDDCICDWLRACEQRVLDAARKALVTAERRLHFDGEDNRWIVEIDALAAIDALRGEQ